MNANSVRAASRAVLAGLALVLAAQLALAAPGLQPWDGAVYADIRQRFGEEAERRMRTLFDLAARNLDEPVESKLRIVNRALNSLPWIADRDQYSRADYWATPMETVATFGGDCEDIAIAKYVMLRAMRVPAKRLALAYVRIRATGEAHMVLLYEADPAAAPGTAPAYVLDQIEPEVLPADQRRDLIAIYTIDSEKHLRVILDTGGTRTLIKAIDDANHAKLERIQQRIAENSAYFRKLNGGRRLF